MPTYSHIIAAEGTVIAETDDDDSIGESAYLSEMGQKYIMEHQKPVKGAWAVVKLPIITKSVRGRTSSSSKPFVG